MPIAFAGFWGGLVPENAHNASVLEDLFEAGALGLKVRENFLPSFCCVVHVFLRISMQLVCTVLESN